MHRTKYCRIGADCKFNFLCTFTAACSAALTCAWDQHGVVEVDRLAWLFHRDTTAFPCHNTKISIAGPEALSNGLTASEVTMTGAASSTTSIGAAIMVRKVSGLSGKVILRSVF